MPFVRPHPCPSPKERGRGESRIKNYI